MNGLITPDQGPILPSQHAGGFEGWVAEQVTNIMGNPAWDTLAGEWGVALPGPDRIVERVDALHDVSDAAWNPRAKQAGPDGKRIERADAVVTQDIKAFDNPEHPAHGAIMHSGDRLEMIQSQLMPTRSVGRLVLGGAPRACWQRAEWSMGYVPTTPVEGETDPAVTWDSRYPYGTPDTFATEAWGPIIAIGSKAPLNDAARKQFGDMMPKNIREKNVVTEADMLYSSVHYLFRTLGSTVTTHGPIPIHEVGYQAQGGGNLRIVNGGGQTAMVYETPHPVSTTRPRANTDESFKMLAVVDSEMLQPDSTVAVVSNAVYKPFQEISFLSYISRYTGTRPVMATFSAAEGGVVRKPSNLLPELHSAVRKAKRFFHPDYPTN